MPCFCYFAFREENNNNNNNKKQATKTKTKHEHFLLYSRSKHKAGVTRGHVDEFWFLTDPEDFNFLCHPEEPDKQLMTSPWTEDVFFNLPGLKAGFFKSDWKLLGPHTAVIETRNGKSSIDLQVRWHKRGLFGFSFLCFFGSSVCGQSDIVGQCVRVGLGRVC